MKVIDGSQGEGGGQVFRTSLTLAMCLGEPVRIVNIRAGRAKPGLLRQHLTCLVAAKAISGADVDGDYIGSQEVTFKPGEIAGGEYEFSVGSAGSTTLIFQTVFLPLLTAQKTSTLTLVGGTHNSMAPSYEFLTKSFLPIMKAMGCDIEAHLECYGFYPAGGGKWTVVITPNNAFRSINIESGSEAYSLRAVAMSTKIPHHIAEREISQVVLQCELDQENTELRYVNSAGPGNIVSLQCERAGIVNVFEAFGQKNVSAEQVAKKAIRMFEVFKHSRVSVAEHLADQLLLPLVCGEGGEFTTSEPSQHLLTNIAVIEAFVGNRIKLIKMNENVWSVTVDKKT